jgi:flagellar biosynthesis anti-sigma factor FlgM
MKIDDKIISYEVSGSMRKISPGAADRLEREKLSPEKQVHEQQRPEGDTIVHLSQATKEAKAIREALASLPDVRDEKVALMREKIESGAYNVDYEGVADKLVDAFMDDLM